MIPWCCWPGVSLAGQISRHADHYIKCTIKCGRMKLLSASVWGDAASLGRGCWPALAPVRVAAVACQPGCCDAVPASPARLPTAPPPSPCTAARSAGRTCWTTPAASPPDSTDHRCNHCRCQIKLSVSSPALASRIHCDSLREWSGSLPAPARLHTAALLLIKPPILSLNPSIRLMNCQRSDKSVWLKLKSW